jgi:hypothetical protein
MTLSRLWSTGLGPLGRLYWQGLPSQCFAVQLECAGCFRHEPEIESQSLRRLSPTNNYPGTQPSPCVHRTSDSAPTIDAEINAMFPEVARLVPDPNGEIRPRGIDGAGVGRPNGSSNVTAWRAWVVASPPANGSDTNTKMIGIELVLSRVTAPPRQAPRR